MATGIKHKNMVLLWENASPTSDFAAQTVSVSLSDYGAVLICFLEDKNDIEREMNQIAFNGHTTFLNAVDTHMFNRKATVSNAGVTFSDCKFPGSYASVPNNTGNAYIVPIRIYGIA